MDVAMQERCPCCGEADCGCGPAEFVRLRYFYGQRLGAVDLTDAQAYVVGKQRFHNLRLHGAGVLCGLKATREVFPQGAKATDPATILRITRGAAIDACGREVIVPGDQCIDVASWFARNRERLKLTSWDASAPRTLWVVLRYRECPSDPAPAPRDPCGCDAGGCEFGRIREAFELALLPEEPACAGATFPTAEVLQDALAEGGFDRAIARLLAEPCPQGEGGSWLCLATVRVTLQEQPAPGPPRVQDISAPDNAIPGRAALLSTAAIQALLGGLAAGAAAEGLIGPGPRLGALTFDAAAGELKVALRLATEGDPPTPVELAGGTFRTRYVTLARFESDAWKTVATSIDLLPAKGIVVSRKAPDTFEPGSYRIAVAASHRAPIVDQKMRPLRPALFARHFRLVASGPALELADPLFS